MKYYFLALISLVGLSAVAQETELPSKADFFQTKIQEAESGERLRWMDSLVGLAKATQEGQYEELLKQTIQFSLELDSLAVATQKTNEHILYLRDEVRDTDSAISVFHSFLSQIESLQSSRDKANFFYFGAGSFSNLFRMDSSLKYCLRALEYAEKWNPRIVGDIHAMIGMVYLQTGKPAEASQELQIALELFRHNKDTVGIIDVKNKMSILYSQHAFYEEAEKERREAIDLIKKAAGPHSPSLFYFNSAADYRMMGDQPKRIENIKLALKHSNSSEEDYFKPFFLFELVIALAENDSLSQAEGYFQQIKNEVDDFDTGFYRGIYVEAEKQLELARGNYAQALQFGEEHLSLNKESALYVEIMNAEKFLADVYLKIRDEQNAQIHLLNYYHIKDSITNVQNTKNLALYQTLYETEKRDLEIEKQKANINLLSLQNRTQIQLLIFGSLGLLLLFTAILIYRSFIQAKKRELAQQLFSQELIKTQEKERTRIAKDLHDGLGQQLTFIKIKAQNNDLPELSSLANSALEDVRGISRDLYPVTLTKLGLTDSIEQLLLELDEQTELFISVEIDDINAEFNEEESLNFYRFVQESISNVLKHAFAKTLIVQINKQKEEINVLIKDNGKGFDLSSTIQKNSLGLKTMAERVNMLRGKLSISSNLENGTSILVQIPA